MSREIDENPIDKRAFFSILFRKEAEQVSFKAMPPPIKRLCSTNKNI